MNNSCILQFGSSQTAQLPVITLPSGLLGADPLVLATLHLDTPSLRNSCVKLDFVTNFNVFGVTAGTLSFQVYKRMVGQYDAIPVGPAWTFGPIAIGYQPISFFVEDCDNSCTGYCGCTYTVEVTASELIVAEIGYASFANSMLAATVCPNGDCSCRS